MLNDSRVVDDNTALKRGFDSRGGEVQLILTARAAKCAISFSSV